MSFPARYATGFDPQALRAGEQFLLAAKPAADDRVVRRDLDVAGVPVRLYEPRNGSSGLPGILHIHGGGFVAFGLDSFDGQCEQLVLEVDAVVAAVDYRLAPEHPFPAAFDDCYAALKWFAGERECIAVLGESAGGALAGGVALAARDRGEVRPAFQVLLCPCLDDRLETPSSREVTDPRTWSRVAAEGSWRAYLGERDAVSPYAAPARAADLRGLPPAYLAVGGQDLMRDETIEYARRLIEAGVPTELHVYPGAFHRFEAVVPGARVSAGALADRFGALRRALHPTRLPKLSVVPARQVDD